MSPLPTRKKWSSCRIIIETLVGWALFSRGDVYVSLQNLGRQAFFDNVARLEEKRWHEMRPL